MLAALVLSLASANPAADNLPAFRTSTAIVQVTPELDWYDIHFVDVERASCELGVSDDNDIVVSRCQFPPGAYGTSTPARNVGPILRAFRKRHRGARNIRVGFLRRGRQVVMEDVVPILGETAGQYAVFDHGEIVFSLDGDGLTLLRSGGGGTGLYCFRDDCNDRYWVPDVTPEALEGTSIFGNVLFPDSPPAYQDAVSAMTPVILDAVAAIDRGESRSWPTDELEHGFPQHGRFGVVWAPRVYARPAPHVAASGARAPDGLAPVFEVTLTDALAGLVDQTVTDESRSLSVRMQMDLPNQWARVDLMVGGNAVWQEFRVVPGVHHEQGNPWWTQPLEWEETSRSEPLDELAIAQGRRVPVGIDGTGDVSRFELYVDPPKRARHVISNEPPEL